ncbi:phosphatase 2C-like domain-containing protein [Mycena albidolilacea]|uniref:Protein phosphatase n=1 Tax=Mycena albidolilacea TaxID=1033008 RepID=A0AAD6Z0K1_9AGAR|nr:phosphatase 2C-like domain-containing protein [Mycena albidolilacea]
MKHPRFYTALPRVGRNSASRALYTNPTVLPLGSLFDAPPPPPPPNTRLTAHRLPIEARGEVEGPNNANTGNPHAPLALAAPHAPANQHPHPAQLALLFPYTPGPTPKPAAAPAASGMRAHRRRGPRYTLDVGAYGIPKRGHRVRGLHARHEPATDAPLAVQVGEDAYFVRENAMGVADGVGGWARVKHPAPPTGPSASALFARRLMHFCADEVDRASHPYLPHPRAESSSSPVVTPSWHDPWSRPPTEAEFAPSSSAVSWRNDYEYDDAWEDEYEHASPADALAAELDELADGLDVLHILERAYERTLGAHVTRTAVPVPTPVWPFLRDNQASTSTQSTAKAKAEPHPKTIPLLAGSSTALVAVLDYVPAGEVDVAIAGGDASPPSTGVGAADGAADAALTPVLKIAHLGDCMGMLVRGGEVAWRSEEMWWRWNTPVQLSAAADSDPAQTATARAEVTPASAAHLFTLPVQAGDILILASDGLSDNLWDEDVLEEVGRVNRAFTGAAATSSAASANAEGGMDGARLRRRTLAGMLSEALCSRARRVATRRAGRERGRPCAVPASEPLACAGSPLADVPEEWADEDDTPFARRAKETGRVYRGGKNDDISVIVAVIAPAEEQRGRGRRGRVEAARAAGS